MFGGWVVGLVCSFWVVMRELMSICRLFMVSFVSVICLYKKWFSGEVGNWSWTAMDGGWWFPSTGWSLDDSGEKRFWTGMGCCWCWGIWGGCWFPLVCCWLADSGGKFDGCIAAWRSASAFCWCCASLGWGRYWDIRGGMLAAFCLEWVLFVPLRWKNLQLTLEHFLSRMDW